MYPPSIVPWIDEAYSIPDPPTQVCHSMLGAWANALHWKRMAKMNGTDRMELDVIDLLHEK
jgi:hypothetical protein